MDNGEKLIAARVGMLALADELKNISRACQVAGISRGHFYDIKDAFERSRAGWPGAERTPSAPDAQRDPARARGPDSRDDRGVSDVQLRPGLSSSG